MKITRVLIIFCLLLTSIFSQKVKSQNIDFSTDNMRQIIAFDTYIYTFKEYPYILPDDTIGYVELLLKYYSKYHSFNNRAFSNMSYYVYFYNNKYEIKLFDTNPKISFGSHYPDDMSKSLYYTLLFFIENTIIKSKDTLNYISVQKKDTSFLLTGEVDVSQLTDIKFYKDELKNYFKEQKHLNQINKYYFKWLKKAKKYGLNYMRINNIRPLDNTKYRWVAKELINK